MTESADATAVPEGAAPSADDGGDDVSRGLLLVSVLVIGLCAAILLLLPSQPVDGWPWAVAAGVAVLLVTGKDRFGLGQGTRAGIEFGLDTAVLLVIALLAPPPVLLLAGLLEVRHWSRRRAVVNVALMLAAVTAGVGAATAVASWAAGLPEPLPAPMPVMLASAAAAVAWWATSSLGMSLVLWHARGVPLAASPVLDREANGLMWSQFVLGITIVVLLRWSPATLPLVAMLVWLLHHQFAAQRLARSAGLDHDTELPLKRAFVSDTEREMARARRTGEPVSVLVVDLDRFGEVNNTHGHAAGDAVLAETAHRIRSALRAGDVVGRTGGEEFSALLVAADLDGAEQVAERVRERVRLVPVRHDGRDIPVTVSVGYAQLLTGEPVEDALKRADVALYEAKDAGRDRTRAAASLRLPAVSAADPD
jgi:diguanylate cyclase (GGDEF)-like protein